MDNINIPLIQKATKTISNSFPRINQDHYIETSFQNNYFDRYYPINNWIVDKFIELRIPPSVNSFIDLNNLLLNFQLQVFKKTKIDSSTWSPNQPTVNGDHYDLCQATGVCLFKHVSITLNGTQITNDANYSYSSLLKVLLNFPIENINKVGRLYHIENYSTIIQALSNDIPFSGLSATDPVSIRLKKIRENGLFLRAPILGDVCSANMFLLDQISLHIRLAIHENSFILLTNQQEPNLSGTSPKKYSIKLSDIYLDVLKYRPTENALNALNKTLLPNNDFVPTIDYMFISKITKNYHLQNGINSYLCDTPFNNVIPERIFLTFLNYDAFNTRDYSINGQYYQHLSLTNISITINGNSIYNVNCDFKKGDVAELYNCLINCVDKHHMITFDNFIKGNTILAFNLANFDNSADIRIAQYGVLRISLTFADKLADSALLTIYGDIMSTMSINYKREVYLT